MGFLVSNTDGTWILYHSFLMKGCCLDRQLERGDERDMRWGRRESPSEQEIETLHLLLLTLLLEVPWILSSSHTY